MSQLTTALGYGQTSIVEQDYFTRLLNEQIYETEEVRFDRPASWDNTFEYIGLALQGSDVSAPVWYCIRRSWVNYRCIRMQFRSNVSWSLRSQGWI